MAFFKEELKKIKAFVFDVDGVLSLPSVSVDPTGELIRTACVKDGYAIMYCGKKGYIVAIDSMGKLCWPQNQFDGMPLLVITSEDCPKEYHDILTKQHISWVATGKDGIDLPRAMEILCEEFGVRRLSVTGGGNINGAFLRAGLLDEVSMMWCPGIDGRKGMAAAFDGLDADIAPTKLQLMSVERMGETIWAKYKV